MAPNAIELQSNAIVSHTDTSAGNQTPAQFKSNKAFLTSASSLQLLSGLSKKAQIHVHAHTHYTGNTQTEINQ